MLDPAQAPLSTALGVLGMPGLTAYVGLKTIGEPKAGETVVVSAASGAVGAVAGQLAQRDGCRGVGIAGGAAKCRYVTEELGFDGCVDHRGDDLGVALEAACPKGIDVYFENVGGHVQRAVYPRLNDFGRMIMCGMIAEYNDVEPRPGPSLVAAVRKRLKIQGLIVSDHAALRSEYLAMAAPLVRSAQLKYREDIVEGIDNAPAAFIGLLQGKNFGKLIIKLDADPTR
jgi:NADPH-dependent curcumin reductase CurA